MSISKESKSKPPGGRVVWVTGAAGGIGRAICDAFVDVGDKVVATDVRSFASQDSVVGLACDVRSTASIARVIEECNRLGGIDVLVNCAGIMRRTDVLELSPELWDEVFDVNVKGPLLCSQAAARSMIDGGRAGSIIHVGSINAEKVFTETVAYCSSKGALHAMGRSMALALAPHGIRVDMVAPGAIDDTDLEPERWGQEQMRAEAVARTPLRRLGKSVDVARSVIFLASEDARYITGETLFIDGGRLASV
jgi:NAD(P)-dependent dehydrogenase (short-subunit alcohol dehydrogenase family)